MTSSDHEILININGQLTKINARLENLETRINAHEVQMNNFAIELAHTNDRIERLQSCVYLGFGLIAVLITLMSFSVPIIVTQIINFLQGQNR